MLALIAGQGRLPVVLAEAMETAGRSFRIFQLEGFVADNPAGRDIPTFAIEELGSFLGQLVSDGFDQVCFAGAIRRPPINPSRIDAATKPLVGRIQLAISSGDDGALRVVAELFEERGLTVVAAQDVVPGLLPDAGVLTAAKPQGHHDADIARAQGVIKECGEKDLGQACVIAGGQVLAIEEMPGTDFMLATLDRAEAADAPTHGGILFKAAKPDQDRRMDLPTIGVGTISGVQKAGLVGIVIPAGEVLVIDLPDVVQACDTAGLFLWVWGEG